MPDVTQLGNFRKVETVNFVDDCQLLCQKYTHSHKVERQKIAAIMRALSLAGAAASGAAASQEQGGLSHSARRTEMRVAPHVVFNQVMHLGTPEAPPHSRPCAIPRAEAVSYLIASTKCPC